MIKSLNLRINFTNLNKITVKMSLDFVLKYLYSALILSGNFKLIGLLLFCKCYTYIQSEGKLMFINNFFLNVL